MKEKSPKKYRIETLLGRLLALLTLVLAVASGIVLLAGFVAGCVPARSATPHSTKRTAGRDQLPSRRDAGTTGGQWRPRLYIAKLRWTMSSRGVSGRDAVACYGARSRPAA